jgi:predicted Zn finger-like uncharacterized protein
MQIVCPHCSTSYGINPASLGAEGRSVRCARCKEVWLARAEDAVELAHQTAGMAQGGEERAEQDTATEWEALAREEEEAPNVDSPSIAGGWTSSDQGQDSAAMTEGDWSSASPDHGRDAASARPGRFAGLGGLLKRGETSRHAPRKSPISPATACAAMGALVLAVVIWRTEMVRLLPQTAAFYKLVGLDVNLRGLRFTDVRVSSETVEGKPVLVIEGAITGESNKPVELPRLRFSVRDAQGAEIYAWNTVLEQPVLRPGEKAVFKSRLASPPPEGRNIDVRFFSKRDLAGGHV